MQIPQLLKKTDLSVGERLNIASHKLRPKGVDVLEFITSSFEQLHGDRLYEDDKAVICAIGEIGQNKCMFVVQQKGSDAKERLKHRFGMMNPDGYRKVLRLVKLAERFKLPVITIIDTPGAYPGLEAEKRGQARAIADNLFEISNIKTPIISLLLGEGCSGGALAAAICDRMIMLEHAYYSVISPEGCASILWKDASKKELSAKALKIQSEDLLRFKMIDQIIDEGEGAFHTNKNEVLLEIKSRLLQALEELKLISLNELMEERYKKYRSF